MEEGFLNLYRFFQQATYQSHYGEAQKLKVAHLNATYPTVSVGSLANEITTVLSEIPN